MALALSVKQSQTASAVAKDRWLVSDCWYAVAG